jgi:hypothetical protein
LINAIWCTIIVCVILRFAATARSLQGHISIMRALIEAVYDTIAVSIDIGSSASTFICIQSIHDTWASIVAIRRAIAVAVCIWGLASTNTDLGFRRI